MLRQLTLLLSVLLFMPGGARGDDLSLDKESTELFDSIMSPYCPGRTLSACPSEDARALRSELRDRLAAGAQLHELRREVLERFEQLEGRPVSTSAKWLMYSVLAVFFALGVLVIFIMLSKKSLE